MSRTLSSREKILGILVATIIGIGGTLVLIQSYTGERANLSARIASQKRQLHSMHELLGQSEMWTQREQWLKAKQPRLENSDTAGVQLLEAVREMARRHAVLIDNTTIRTPEPRPNCISVGLDIETKSPWASIVGLLEELQTPNQFIALESANLKVDPNDATQVRGHFKIARWYAAN